MKQFLLVFLLLFLRTVKGQLHSQGRYKPQEYDVARENIYNIDPPAIAQESIIQNSSSPFRFAKAIPVSIPFSVKQTIIRDDVITWKIKIQSSGALSLSLIFDRFWLPEHSELYIYNEQVPKKKA
jgi:hypothetical protein